MAVNNLPPIPQDKIGEVQSWRDWFRNLGTYIQQAQSGNIVTPIIAGGTGATNATGARINLGLGTLATQNSDNVAITGGTISGVNLTGSTIPYTNVSGLATVAHTGAYSDLTGKPTGLTVTITTAKLTVTGANGSMTFSNGILTAQTQAT